MSEIRLMLNPDVGNVEKIQVLADSEEGQMHTLQRLQVFLGEINKFSRESMRRATLEKGIHKREPATVDTAL